jgi:hypothetical protein
MAARFDLLVGRQHQRPMLRAGRQTPALSLGERVARIQRKRRLGRTADFVESVLWLTGAAFVAAVAVAGITGLH